MTRFVPAVVVLGLSGWFSVALADEPSETVSSDEFVAKAATSGSTELELGKIALQFGEGAELKAFAQQVILDHAAANKELIAMAARKQIAVPKNVDSKQKDAIAKLSKLRGAEFDRAFASQMVKDHTAGVALFRSESERGQDPELKAYATKVLPTLKEHLRLARVLNGETAAEAQASSDRPRD